MKPGVAAAVLLALLSSAHAQTPDENLKKNVNDAVAQTIEQFKDQKLKEEELAVTVIDLRDPNQLRSGSFRGDAGIYPASVVKLFYLVATHRWLEDGKLKDSDELRRGMRDMIVDSTNDATNWILEAVTDAGNGPLLDDAEWAKWVEKRNAINRYFASMGYMGINTCQKTFIEGPYGRDKLFLAQGGSNRNKLTTDATARLLSEIALGKAVTPTRSKQMMDLLKRDPTTKPSTDNQNTDFTARALPKGSKLWCKSGWTSTARHDAAYVELPDGRKFVLVVFTYNHGRERELLPTVARKIIASLRTDGGA
jgi:hypothetical protein